MSTYNSLVELTLNHLLYPFTRSVSRALGNQRETPLLRQNQPHFSQSYICQKKSEDLGAGKSESRRKVQVFPPLMEAERSGQEMIEVVGASPFNSETSEF